MLDKNPESIMANSLSRATATPGNATPSNQESAATTATTGTAGTTGARYSTRRQIAGILRSLFECFPRRPPTSQGREAANFSGFHGAAARSRADIRASSQSASDPFEIERRKTFRDRTPIGFAKSKIERDPRGFFARIHRYPFTDDEKLELADELTQYGDVMDAAVFQMEKRSNKIALAVRLISANSDSREACRVSGLWKPDDLFAVGLQLKDYSLDDFADNFKFDKAEQRTKLAFRLAETYSHGALFLGGLEKFELSPERWREAVFIAADNLEATIMIGDLSDKCRLSDPEDQKQFMLRLASSSPRCCVASQRLLSGLDEPTRKELANKVGKSNPSMLLECIDRFEISNENDRLKLFQDHFARGIEQILQDATASCYQQSDPTPLFQLLQNLSEKTQAIVIGFFGDNPALPNFSEHADKLGIREHWIALMLDAARQHPPHMAEMLSQWTHCVNLLFRSGSVAVPDTAGDSFRSTLDAIFQYRKPGARFPLTDMLARPFMLDDKRKADGNSLDIWNTVSQQLTRAHSLVFRPVLFELKRQKALDDALLGRLSHAVSQQACRDTEVMNRIMNGLLALTSEKPDCDEKRRLVKALIPQQLTKPDIKTFAAAMQALSEMVALLAQSGLEKLAQSELKSVESAADLPPALAKMMFFVLDRENHMSKNLAPKAFLDRLWAYNKKLGRPSAIIPYAARLAGELNEEEKKELFAVINRFVDATILSDDPDGFKNAKNDITVSRHLQEAARINHPATERWLNIEKDLSDVFSNVAPATPGKRPNRDFSKWRVQFVQDPEVYLESGSVGGSCMNVHGNVGNNRAAMGYVIQWKYRIVAVIGPDGTLQARRVVRFLIDETADELIMHVEQKYENEGVPKNCDEVMMGLLNDIAQEIGVPLVTHDPGIGTGPEYPNELHSYPDSAVYEYVDAQSRGIVNSGEGYSLRGARYVVVSPASSAQAPATVHP